MPTQTETRPGRCPTHGDVDATREMPRPGFPFALYAVRRLLAARTPFRCPVCGAPVAPA